MADFIVMAKIAAQDEQDAAEVIHGSNFEVLDVYEAPSHPEEENRFFPIKAWQRAVFNNETLLGYHHWVDHQRDEE